MLRWHLRCINARTLKVKFYFQGVQLIIRTSDFTFLVCGQLQLFLILTRVLSTVQLSSHSLNIRIAEKPVKKQIEVLNYMYGELSKPKYTVKCARGFENTLRNICCEIKQKL